MFEIVKEEGGLIEYSLVKFSGGELQPRLKEPIIDNVMIRADLCSSDSIFELMLLVDAIRRSGGPGKQIHLECPYLPYARQDRVCAEGESLALRVMCNLINDQAFTSVTIWDPHSDVATALIDRVQVKSQASFVTQMELPGDIILVSPDAGANKKTLEIAKATNWRMVRADKIRDPRDGSITDTVVYSNHIGDKNFLIVDDICDGGRTFIELAKVLRPLTNGKVYLYVTHGIFSKGLDVFRGLIDQVYTANPFPSVDLTHPLLAVVLEG